MEFVNIAPVFSLSVFQLVIFNLKVFVAASIYPVHQKHGSMKKLAIAFNLSTEFLNKKSPTVKFSFNAIKFLETVVLMLRLRPKGPHSGFAALGDIFEKSSIFTNFSTFLVRAIRFKRMKSLCFYFWHCEFLKVFCWKKFFNIVF